MRTPRPVPSGDFGEISGVVLDAYTRGRTRTELAGRVTCAFHRDLFSASGSSDKDY